MNLIRSLMPALLIVLASPIAVSAHDSATLDSMPSPHGGQVRMAGPYHIELVIAPAASTQADRAVQVFLTDHANRPVPAAGASGALRFDDGSNATLTAQPGNRLTGSIRVDNEPSRQASLSLHFKDGSAWEVSYTPFAPRPAASTSVVPSAHVHDAHSHTAH